MPTSLTPDIIGFIMVFARVGAITMFLPAIGEDQAPVRIRLMFALFLSAVIYPTLLLSLPPVAQNMAGLAGGLGREIIIGIMMGTIVRLFMLSLHTAGTIIAMQTGFASAIQYDPSQGGQATVVTRFLGVLGVIIIFGSGLHHIFIGGIVRTYAIFSPRDTINVADFSTLMLNIVAQSFALGIQMSAPFLAFGIILNVGLGLMGRLAPQIQIFFVAQPLSLMLGIALFLASIGTMMTVFITHFADAIRPYFGG
jgi:flagellar biosynthesis protein FliR